MLAAQTAQDPAVLAMLGQPYQVENIVRLALTPRLDGTLEAEEWDTLASSGTATAYMQWEPDTYYWAMKLSNTEDAVFSLDANADGWLVGADNLELRVGMVEGEPRVKIRTLDATDPNGPQWVPGGIAPDALKIAAQPTANGWSVEAAFTPTVGQGPQSGKRIGARLDAIPANNDLAQAFLPRGMAFLVMALDSSLNLPPNFSWRPTMRSRATSREDKFEVRYDLNRDGQTFNPASFSYRGEGYARDEVAQGTTPFPPFDDRGRVTLNYNTIISRSAEPGWRVLRATLTRENGEEVILRSSFRIADMVDFEVRLPESIPASQEAQVIRGSVIVRSQYNGRLEGTFTCSIPDEWSMVRGTEEKFLIYHSRGSARVGVEFIVPRNTAGLFPITFTAKVGEETITKTVYIPVE